jgi:phosphorylcholine metabolism protein LicD
MIMIILGCTIAVLVLYHNSDFFLTTTATAHLEKQGETAAAPKTLMTQSLKQSTSSQPSLTPSKTKINQQSKSIRQSKASSSSTSSSSIKELPCCNRNNKRCDWVNKSPYTQPKCEERNLLLILEWVDEVFAHANIEWMITWGTLLGSFRKGKHIEHETDIDIAVNVNHWTRMEDVLQEKIKGTHFRYKWKNKHLNAPASIDFSTKNTIHVDVWQFNKYKTTSTIHGSKSYNVHNNKLFPLKLCPYSSTHGGTAMYPCPNDTQWFLNTEYGAEWHISKPKYGKKKTFSDREASTQIPMSLHSCPLLPFQQGPWSSIYNTKKPSKAALSPKSIKFYNVLVDVVNTLDSIDCPYNLHGGTLLNFVRDCAIKDSDIDVAIPFKWRKKNNQLMIDTFQKNGFTYYYKFGVFGTIDEFGYEIAWKKNGVKIDTFTIINEKDRYISGLWENYPSSKRIYQCEARRLDVGTALWGNLEVRVPIPYDMVLTSWYGNTWKKPYKGQWQWFHSSFSIGSCGKGPDGEPIDITRDSNGRKRWSKQTEKAVGVGTNYMVVGTKDRASLLSTMMKLIGFFSIFLALCYCINNLMSYEVYDINSSVSAAQL